MALETKDVPLEVVKQYRSVPHKDIFKLFPKKFKNSVIYFLNTGRDTKNIMRELKKHNFNQKGRSKMYNQTIEVSDWDLAAMAKRLELRYNSRCIYAHLHRELKQNEYDYTYSMILRLFTRYRDTTGGKLWEAINEIVNSK